MKPKEFDELLKQKFDQNDFEYNPANWALLEDELDGRAKKRSIFLGWLIPLMGIAATIAMAFGVSFVWRAANTGSAEHTSMVLTTTSPINTPLPAATLLSPVVAPNAPVPSKATLHRFVAKKPLLAVAIALTTDDNDSIANTHAPDKALAAKAGASDIPMSADTFLVRKKKKIILNQAMYTFKQDIAAAPKTPRTSLIISGGFNFGNQTSGYSFGASARRMVNDKVFVEGDIAFTGATNTQQVMYLDNTNTASGYARTTVGSNGFAAKSTLTSKNSSTDNSGIDLAGNIPGTIKTANRQYNLYYAQVTPTIGYKLLKRMSVGIGPDFQKMLVDNRPEASTVDRGNIKEAPSFDIGFMGKTEFAFTKSIKAAVYYREGINNIVTPTNKYIDRSYLQVQLKCAILNK